MDYSTPGSPVFHISQKLFKFMSIDWVILSNHLILCGPLLLPSIFSSIRVSSMSQLFAPGGQSIGASESVLPMNIQGWFPLGLTGLTSLQSKGLSSVFSNTTIQKNQFFGVQQFLMIQFLHLWMITGKTIALTTDLCWQTDSNTDLKESLPKAYLLEDRLSKSVFLTCTMKSSSEAVLYFNIDKTLELQNASAII